MDYLKSYVEIHLKYWYCYVGILILSVLSFISAICIIRLIAVVINLKIANIVGYIILCTMPTASLAVPNFQLAKQYGSTKARVCMLFLVYQAFSVAINSFIVYILFA